MIPDVHQVTTKLNVNRQEVETTIEPLYNGHPGAEDYWTLQRDFNKIQKVSIRFPKIGIYVHILTHFDMIVLVIELFLQL